MDISQSLVARSDQLNATDLLGGPITVTITKVTRGNDEQPFNFHMEEFPRPFKPSKNMRRLIAHAWGNDTDNYIGRRVTLYRDPDVKFGKETPGGVRISHMSGIPKRLTASLMVSKGKYATFIVDPLPDSAPTSAPVSEIDLLKAEWKSATPERKKEIEADVARIKAEGAGE